MAHYRTIMVDDIKYEYKVWRDGLKIKGIGEFTMGAVDPTYMSAVCWCGDKFCSYENGHGQPAVRPSDIERLIRLTLG
jgi:hypothetical protein